jgi:3-hydroxyisobutyrate dehydrogenase-like beta-hydroxyacid dehydrogenase
VTRKRSASSLLVSQERAYSLAVKEGWFEMVDAPVRKRPAAKAIKQLAAMTKAERLRYWS